MAAKTRTEMIDRALRRLGVLGVGQTASTEDATLVGEVLDSLHDQLRKKRLANFSTTSFPDWAQEPFTKCLVEEVAPYFGQNRQGMRALGEKQLTEQLSGKLHARSVPFSSF